MTCRLSREVRSTAFHAELGSADSSTVNCNDNLWALTFLRPPTRRIGHTVSAHFYAFIGMAIRSSTICMSH